MFPKYGNIWIIKTEWFRSIRLHCHTLLCAPSKLFIFHTIKPKKRMRMHRLLIIIIFFTFSSTVVWLYSHVISHAGCCPFKAFISLVHAMAGFLAFWSTVFCIWHGVNYIKTIFGYFSFFMFVIIQFGSVQCSRKTKQLLIIIYFIIIFPTEHVLVFSFCSGEHFAWTSENDTQKKKK